LYFLFAGESSGRRSSHAPSRHISIPPHRETISYNNTNFTPSYYIRRLPSDPNQNAILLVPTDQFVAFLATVNESLGLQLTIPSGHRGSAFQVNFENDATPKPRYLGKSTNQEMADDLHNKVPPNWYKHKSEATTDTPAASDPDLAAFKRKIELIAQAQKGKKLMNTEKKRLERIAKQQSWNHLTKRVQRYLGLRGAMVKDAVPRYVNFQQYF